MRLMPRLFGMERPVKALAQQADTAHGGHRYQAYDCTSHY